MEKFIDDIHNENIEILAEAQKLMLMSESKKFGIAKTKKKIGTLAFLMGEAISSYQQSKDNAFLRLKTARTLSEYIEWAYTHKIVKDIKLGSQLEELKKENEDLKKSLERLRNYNENIEKENKELHRFMESKSGDKVISDV